MEKLRITLALGLAVSVAPVHAGQHRSGYASRTKSKSVHLAENTSPNTRQEWAASSAIVNAAASRLVKSLGCVVAVDDSNVLREVVETWGPRVQALGRNPRMINGKSSYDSLSQNIVWDYLDDPKACGSVRTECYRRLNRPVEELFAMFRLNDLRDAGVQRRLKEQINEINAIVVELRKAGDRPPCRVDRDHAADQVLHANSVSDDFIQALDAPASPAPTPEPERKPSAIEPKESASTAGLSLDLKQAREKLVAAGASPAGVDKALAYYAKNRHQFTNHNYITFLDFTQNSMRERLYQLDMRTGELVAEDKVMHGVNSGGIGGVPKSFSNEHGTLKSSVGAYRMAETDNNSKRSVRKYRIWLDGLEKTNDEARNRGVYMHEAVNRAGVEYWRFGGRSHGCPAMSTKGILDMQKRNVKGSFMYIYSDKA